MCKTLTRLTLLFLAGTMAAQAISAKPPRISEATLLREMTDRDQLARLPEQAYTTRQFSSYDRRSVAPEKPGWFGNDDWSMFVRSEQIDERTEHVLLDADGPGAIVRFWMTFAGKDCGQGTLRVYIDNAAEPVLEATAFEILSGARVAPEPLAASVSPLMRHDRRGHNLYYPIPYARHCKVTYESPNVYAGTDPEKRKGTENVYYNIECRTYTEPVEVVSYTGKSDTNLAKITDATTHALIPSAEEAPRPGVKTTPFESALAPGDSATYTLRGARAVRRLALALSAAELPQALRSTVISIRFDGERTVWVPVGDFFGVGYKSLDNNTFFNHCTASGQMASLWVMPFARECEITFHNYGTQPVALEGSAAHTPWKWDDSSLHFGASWHQHTRIATGANTRSTPADLTYACLEGEGRLAGDCLTLYNDGNGWWGEGDEKIYVDGEQFPSHFGTGTEDYYGYAWCRPEVFTGHPFIAMPAGDGNLAIGYTVNSRCRMLDAIPFSRSLRFDMELYHWQEARMNYAPTTIWYMRPGGKCSVAPDIDGVRERVVTRREQLTPPALGATIEGEDMEIVACTGGKAYSQFRYNSLLWSGNTQLFWQNAPVGSQLTLRFESACDAEAELEAVCSLAIDYGTTSVSLNGEALTPALNLHAPELTIRKIMLGKGHLRKGSNTLILTAEAPAAGFEKCFAGIDRLIFHLK